MSAETSPAESQIVLSICIPTHQGRCAVLREAIDSILTQLSSRSDVEICVSDNASHDETQAMMEELSQKVSCVRYLRHPVDTRHWNFHHVVSMARGEWCLLLGSDDRLAPDAITRIIHAVRDDSHCAGLSFRRVNYDRTMQFEAAQDSPLLYPQNPSESRVFQTPSESLENLGLYFTYMSGHAFRRGAWLNIVNGSGRARFEQEVVFPHTWVWCSLATVSCWRWEPWVGVWNRTDNQCYAELLDNQRHRYLISTTSALLKILRDAAPDAAARQRLTRRVFQAWASAGAIIFCKRQPNHDSRADRELQHELEVLYQELPEWKKQRWLLKIPHRLVKATMKVLRR